MLRPDDAAKVLAVSQNLPIVSTDGQVFDRYVMLVQIRNVNKYYSYEEWRYNKCNKTKNIGNEYLCQWCYQNSIEHLPVLVTKSTVDTYYFDKWLKKYYG